MKFLGEPQLKVNEETLTGLMQRDEYWKYPTRRWVVESDK
jgi:hypothetical protein